MIHISRSNEASFSQQKGLRRTYCDQRARSPVQTGVSKRGGLVPQSWAASSGLEPSALPGSPGSLLPLLSPLVFFFFFFIFCALPSARASCIAWLPRVPSRRLLSPCLTSFQAGNPAGKGAALSTCLYMNQGRTCHEAALGPVTASSWPGDGGTLGLLPPRTPGDTGVVLQSWQHSGRTPAILDGVVALRAETEGRTFQQREELLRGPGVFRRVGHSGRGKLPGWRELSANGAMVSMRVGTWRQ